MNELVSIIIPTFNGSLFLSQAIESALKQTYKNIEIIVVDDGTIDGGKTKSICDKYKDRIQYIKKPNGGCSSALNCGILHSKGSFISWLSHDDLYDCTKVEKELQCYEKFSLDSEKTIIACWSNNIDVDGIIHKRRVIKYCKYFNSKKSQNYLLRGKTFNGLGLLIPRKIILDFNVSLFYVLDWEMWLRLSDNGVSFYLLRDTLVYNRKHSEQVSQKYQNLYKKEMEECMGIFFDNYIEKRNFSNALLCFYFLEKRNFESGKMKLCLHKNGVKINYLVIYLGRINYYIKKILKKFF